jgi:CubicO group peptidase (beta-lactamase class C family)
LVFARGWRARGRKPEPVDTQTIFAIASTTKALTAAALGMLVDEGKVRWDDPVTKYVPSFQMYDPWATREATVRDLITHRAGLPNADYLWTGGDNSRDEVIRRIRFIPPSYSFRGGYTYHNVMYTVAGAVIEAASGMTWDEFVRRRIFESLGMTRSVTTLAEAVKKDNRAQPHGSRGDTLRMSGNSLADGIGPAGSVWSSVADMSKWVRFLLDTGRVNGKALLTPATWSELFKPATMLPPWNDRSAPQLRLSKPHFRTYALGWFQQDYGEDRSIPHRVAHRHDRHQRPDSRGRDRRLHPQQHQHRDPSRADVQGLRHVYGNAHATGVPRCWPCSAPTTRATTRRIRARPTSVSRARSRACHSSDMPARSSTRCTAR